MKPPPRTARATTFRRLASLAEPSLSSSEIASEPTTEVTPLPGDDADRDTPPYRPTRKQRFEASRLLLVTWRDEVQAYAPYTEKFLPASYDFASQRFARRLASRLGPIANGEYLRPMQVHGKMKFIRRAHGKRLGPLRKLRDEVLETEALVTTTCAKHLLSNRSRTTRRMREKLANSRTVARERSEEPPESVSRKRQRNDRSAPQRRTPAKARTSGGVEPASEERAGARRPSRSQALYRDEDSYTVIAGQARAENGGPATTPARRGERSAWSLEAHQDKDIDARPLDELLHESDLPDDEIAGTAQDHTRAAEQDVEREEGASKGESSDDMVRWEKKKRLIEQLRETAEVLHRVEMPGMVEKMMLRACQLLDEEAL